MTSAAIVVAVSGPGWSAGGGRPVCEGAAAAGGRLGAERYVEAGEAYERFRKHFASYKHIADIELMLGMIYGRYLQRYAEAVELLERAAKGLTDSRKQQLAETELQAARKKLTDPSTG